MSEQSKERGLTAGVIVRDVLLAAMVGTLGWSATEFQAMRVALVEVKTTMRNYDKLEQRVTDAERQIAVMQSRMDAYHGSRP